MLEQKQIHHIHETAIELGLHEQREALLSGWPKTATAGFTKANNAQSQLLIDLNTLNQQASAQPNQAESLLEIWLNTAHHLSKHDPKSEVFLVALKEIRARRPPPPLLSPQQVFHTSIIIDRTKQWKTLLECCEKRKEHLVFLVHGTQANAPGPFAHRIARHLHAECKKRHATKIIHGSHDGIRADAQELWQRYFIYASDLGKGALGPALEEDARTGPVLYLVLDKDEPLKDSNAASIRELGEFIRHGLSDALLLRKRDLRHPLRVVIPIEHAPSPPAGHPLILELQATLSNARALKIIPIDELSFPLWNEVADWLIQCHGDDDTLLEECMTVYRQNPHNLVDLGNRLHDCIVAYKQKRR